MPRRVTRPMRPMLRFFPIVFRDDWGARPARGGGVRMTPPVKTVVFDFHPADISPCDNQEDCTRQVRKMQMRHMEAGMLDIHYNFLFGGDGLVYEGRGWFVQSSLSAKTPQFHGNRLDIAYIGDDTKDPYQPPHVFVNPPLKLIQYGVRAGFLREVYRVHEENGLKSNLNLEDTNTL